MGKVSIHLIRTDAWMIKHFKKPPQSTAVNIKGLCPTFSVTIS